MAKIPDALLNVLNSNQVRAAEALPIAEVAPEDPRIHGIVEMLKLDPMLVEPTKRFIDQKIAAASRAKLMAYYSPAELEEMLDRNGVPEEQREALR